MPDRNGANQPEEEREKVSEALYILLKQADDMFERTEATAAVLDEAYAGQEQRYAIPGTEQEKVADGLGLEGKRDASTEASPEKKGDGVREGGEKERE